MTLVRRQKKNNNIIRNQNVHGRKTRLWWMDETKRNEHSRFKKEARERSREKERELEREK